MTWVQLSLKEWQRRPVRTAVTAGGVAIAIGALFSLLSFVRGYRQGVAHELDRLGAHVLLVPKGCPYDAASMALHGASWPCYLKESYLIEVRSVSGIAAVAPVFMAALSDPGQEQAVYVGVQTNILALKPGWRIRGSFPVQRGTILAGSEVARQLGWSLGQRVRLPGLSNESAIVTGLLAPTHGADDTFIHLPLDYAQRLFGHTNELTHILIRLADPNQLDHAVSQLRGCDAGLSMNVVPLAHVFHTIQSLVNSTRVLMGCVALVALLVAGTGVSNTILTAVTERRSEIGMMRAVGASPAKIFQLIWLETVQTCLGGAMVGILIACLASRVVEGWLRTTLPFAPADPLVHWEWGVASACLACSLALGSLAGLLPAWRASTLPPVLAIRS